MPPPKPDDENLKFLFTCFQSAVKNGGKVDMRVVAAAHQINVGAASMRLTRLRKALEAPSEQDTAADNAEESAAGATPKSTKTPKPRAPKASPVGAPKTNGSEINASTPTPLADVKEKNKPKAKKRKLSETEQVDALIQRAGIEALTNAEMDPQTAIDQLRAVMLQSNDEELVAQCSRQIAEIEQSIA